MLPYLQPNEYVAHGIPNASAADVVRATAYINSWLRRPEGLIWGPDGAGNPCYMASATASGQFTLGAAISPGTSVQVAVSGPLMGLNIGDSLTADRANQSVTEAVVVTAKSGNVITLGSVEFAHADGTFLESGLAITERRRMPKGRPLIQVMRPQLRRILSGRGRYAYGRRADAAGGNTDDFNLLAVYNTFGGPPAWEIFNPMSTDFDSNTGQVWIPAGIMLAYYTEVEMSYVAGFAQAALPEEIKTVCGMLVTSLANDPGLGPVKSYRAGDTAIQKFSDSLISADMASMLQPYRARTMV